MLQALARPRLVTQRSNCLRNVNAAHNCQVYCIHNPVTWANVGTQRRGGWRRRGPNPAHARVRAHGGGHAVGQRGQGTRTGRDPGALPGPVPAGRPDLPGTDLRGAGRDRHHGIRQRPVAGPGRAPGQEPQGRRGADAVRAGHVRRIRRPRRPVRPAHPLQPGGRHLHRGPDAVRRRRRGRVGAGASAGRSTPTTTPAGTSGTSSPSPPGSRRKRGPATTLATVRPATTRTGRRSGTVGPGRPRPGTGGPRGLACARVRAVRPGMVADSQGPTPGSARPRGRTSPGPRRRWRWWAHPA